MEKPLEAIVMICNGRRGKAYKLASNSAHGFKQGCRSASRGALNRKQARFLLCLYNKKKACKKTRSESNW